MNLQFWGCLAIRVVRKNVSAGQLIHQTNPAQLFVFGVQIEKVEGGTHPLLLNEGRIAKRGFRFAILAEK